MTKKEGCTKAESIALNMASGAENLKQWWKSEPHGNGRKLKTNRVLSNTSEVGCNPTFYIF